MVVLLKIGSKCAGFRAKSVHISGHLPFVQEIYASKGGPSIDPVVFFTLQLVMFFEDIRPERFLMRVVADRLSVRWYLGYDLDDPLPDHSSLSRTRTRYGLDIFRRFL
jgi:transposase